MPKLNFQLLEPASDQTKINIDQVVEQLVALMTKMYDYHATLHPDWRTNPGWQEGSTRWLTNAANSDDWYVALLMADKVENACGYALANFHYEAPLFLQNRYGYIADLWVEEAYRGQGGAELLLEGAYAWFRRQQVERIQLEVDVRNERGKHFWHKQGFEDFQLVMRRNLKVE